MADQVNPQETVPEVPLESTTEGGSDDKSQISLEQLNSLLGRDYKDVDTALDSVKETYSFVGKRDELRQSVEEVMKATGADEQTVITKLKANLMSTEETQKPKEETVSPDTVPRSQYLEDRFFDKNPELEGLRDYIKPIKESSPEFKEMSWDEFAKTDKVEKLVSTFSGYEEANSKKSVVESNPRLGAASDKLDKARQALQENNDASARQSAVGAVIDSFSE